MKKDDYIFFGCIIAVLVIASIVFLTTRDLDTEPEIPVEPYTYLTTDDGLLPLTDWDEAMLLAIEMFGSEELFDCSGPDMLMDTRYVPDTEFLFGCDIITSYDTEGRPEESVQVMRLIFNPTDSYITEMVCDYETYPDLCPKDIDGEYIWIRR